MTKQDKQGMSGKLHKPLSQTPAIKLAGVCQSFGSRVVLQQISFQLTAGEGICICGPNAAGKTTLLRIISTIFKPSEGVVEIFGFNVHRHAQRIKPLIGAIFHKSMVYPQLTVVENLRFFATIYGVKNSKPRIERLLEQSSLTPYRYDSPAVLSRGMAQRLAISRALVHEPSVLLADEPFTGLDAEAGKYFITTLHDFKDNGGAVVMTTHNADFALRCCERVAVLDNGELIFSAKVSEVDTAEFTRHYLLYARGKS